MSFKLHNFFRFSRFFGNGTKRRIHFEIHLPFTKKFCILFLEILGQQLSNLWSVLEKFPSIIVQKNSPESWELAQKLQNEIEINTVAALDTKSIMLIMDRGMDLVAPLVHDITFQVCKALLLPLYLIQRWQEL